MFLHNILRRNPSQLIYKIYQAQTLKMVRNDWFQTIQNDKKTYDILLSDEEIRLLSKSKFKQLIERKINFKAFTDILNSRKVKMDGLLKCIKLNKNGKIPMQKYLTTNLLSTFQKQVLFSLRCRSAKFKSNYSSQYEDDMRCRICLKDDTYENEQHTFHECSVILNQISINQEVNIDHIYGNINEQINAARYYSSILKIRQCILDLKQDQRTTAGSSN